MTPRTRCDRALLRWAAPRSVEPRIPRVSPIRRRSLGQPDLGSGHVESCGRPHDGAREPVDPMRALRRLPASLACHTDFRRQGVASQPSCARHKRVSGIWLMGRSADPLVSGCARQLPCLLPPRNPHGPGDPARTAPGAMGSAVSLLLLLVEAVSAAWGGRCVVVVCWAAGRGPFGCSDSPGAMELCQENNEIERFYQILYKYNCQREGEYLLTTTRNR